MKFLVDQDVYAITIGVLSGLGHDAVRAAELGLADAGDAELLRITHEQQRVFVTRDRDFGALVFVQGGDQECSIFESCLRQATPYMPNSNGSLRQIASRNC